VVALRRTLHCGSSQSLRSRSPFVGLFGMIICPRRRVAAPASTFPLLEGSDHVLWRIRRLVGAVRCEPASCRAGSRSWPVSERRKRKQYRRKQAINTARRTGSYEREQAFWMALQLARRFGAELPQGGQGAPVTLGYPKVVIIIRKAAGPGYAAPMRPGQSGLRWAPQKPHSSATRRPVPTGIPQTEQHTPVHLLCVLKTRKLAGQQRRCA
jgi:hypothetical protein